MTGARVLPCESDTIHRHECAATAVEQGRAREKYDAEARKGLRKRGRRTGVTVYSKPVVCATLINKKSLNFLRRAERKNGSILLPRIDVSVYPLASECEFSVQINRHLRLACNI